jgi:hypothetical protein
MMRSAIWLIFSAAVGFTGFILGIVYTVQAADTSLLVRAISVLKGLIGA